MSEVTLQKIDRRLTVQQIERALSRSLKERYDNNMVIMERGNRNSFFGILIKKLAGVGVSYFGFESKNLHTYS